MNEIATQLNSSSKVRPFIRFFARNIDYAIFSIIIAVIWRAFLSKPISIGDIAFNLLILFLWVFIEPICLSILGTTFGKSLLKVKIRTVEGKKLPFFNALKRSGLVWLRALGVGIPIISLFAMFVAGKKLIHNGISSWDKDCNSIVIHQKIGIIRSVIAIVYIFFVIYGVLKSKNLI